MNKIYTKTGDQGMTQLCDGKRIAKDSPKITACGAVDELNAFLGLALAYIKDKVLQQRLMHIQNELIKLNSQLALAPMQEIINMLDVQRLEQEIDDMNSHLPALTKFIPPGGNKITAHLHVARTICRRAEREVVTIATTENLNDAVIPYLNRLSDWLFTAARVTENTNENIT
jgi:cob(I)alamin adenosyltransferase